MEFSKFDENNYGEFVGYIRSLSDEKYREFHSSIVKETDSEILGVRIPILRSVAKEILKGDVEGFLRCAGRTYYEEVLLRGLVVAQMKGGFEDTKCRVDDFVTWIDNWAVCDTFCSTFKNIKKFHAEFFEHIDTYLGSPNPWAVRVGIVLMMNYYLTDEYIDRVLSRAEKIRSDEYYVRMGKAWLLATAFAKYRDKTLEHIRTADIDETTLSMTIQKCVDSYRVSREDKQLLRSMRPAKKRKSTP